MKHIMFYLLIFSCFKSACGQKKEITIDSMARLVQQNFNARDVNAMYELTGDAFRQQISREQFADITTKELFPLGNMTEPKIVSRKDGISKYRVDFPSGPLALHLGLDKKGKLETFLLNEFTEEKRKEVKVLSTNVLKTEMDKAVDVAVQPYITLETATGLSIGIIRDGQEFYYGYGETKKGSAILPDQHTIFEIGSITKTFTGILLANAVNNGRLKLDEAFNKALPDSLPLLTFEGVPVTLKMLSNHTSSIPRMPDNFGFFTDARNPYKNYSSSQMFDYYKKLKLQRKPGSVYEYSNLAVATLGVVLEKVYNKPFSELLKEQILDPLGMKETRQFILKEDSARVAAGYNEQGQFNGPWDFKAFVAAGGIRSTASDMLRYVKANLGEAPAPLKKAISLSHQVTFDDGKNKLGLGWHFIKAEKDELLFHNGGTGGYRSYLAINPQKKFAVVILSNTSIGTEETGNQIMKWLEKNHK